MDRIFDSMERKSGETNDCTVHTMARTCNVTYDEAHAWLEARGRQRRRGAFLGQILWNVERNGGMLGGCKLVEVKKSARTVGKFIEKNPTGRFIIRVRHHALAVVNGRCFDTASVPDGTRIKTVHRVYTDSTLPLFTAQPVTDASPRQVRRAARKLARIAKYVQSNKEAFELVSTARELMLQK